MTDNPLVTQGFNLARHVADEPSRVEAARARLATLLQGGLTAVLPFTYT